MGTRGIYGIRKDNVDKCFLNTQDSYPKCLGNKVLDIIREVNLKELYDKLVETKDIEKDEVFGRNIIKLTSKDKIFFCNDVDFIKDALNCEWGYLINLDTNKLEVYKGQNKTEDLKCRYKNIPIIIGNEIWEYYTHLVAEVNLQSIIDNNDFKFNTNEF
ncbi:hypothetical protein ACRTAL_002416 [Clostridium perfringens]